MGILQIDLGSRHLGDRLENTQVRIAWGQAILGRENCNVPFLRKWLVGVVSLSVGFL